MNLFDLHCDTATALYRNDLSFDNEKTHLNAKNVEGHTVIQCFAVFLNDQKNPPDGMDFFDGVVRTVFPQLHRPGLTPILTVEGAGVLARDPNWIEKIAAAGCKMAGLVWNGTNPLATGAVTDDKAGLTPLGKKTVLELIARKIAVDVSHLSAKGTEELLSLTDAPVVASHSNARRIHDHPRNLSDEAAKEIFARGGLVGLNLYPQFLCSHNAGVDDILRHAEHFLSLGGKDGLALGCDLDGIDELPEGMKDFSSLPLLYDRFRSAFGAETADDIFYRNGKNFFDYFS